MIRESFQSRLAPSWHPTHIGGGRLVIGQTGLRFLVESAQRRRYADAQIADYAASSRQQFRWRPPLRLIVRARASAGLLGTAGFGFWNHPFSPLGGLPTLPSALWFFHASPPSDLPLAHHVPGHGWKAACIDATKPGALAWAPFAVPVMLFNHVPWFYRRVWPQVQRSLAIAEAPIAPPTTTWCTYELEWREQGARFIVDGSIVLETDRAPTGPLGFIAWVDNQWAVATPWGHFGWGLLTIDTPQWMDIAQIVITPDEDMVRPQRKDKFAEVAPIG